VSRRSLGVATRKHGDTAPWLQQLIEHVLDFGIHAQQNLIVLREQKMRWPRRPPRLGRLFDNTPSLYLVTFNSYKRLPLLACPEVHAAFQMFCFKAQEHDVAVGRYVIMPEHPSLCRLSSGRCHLAALGGIVAQRDRQEVTQAWSFQAALAGRFL
jgi:hypothetical protein